MISTWLRALLLALLCPAAASLVAQPCNDHPARENSNPNLFRTGTDVILPGQVYVVYSGLKTDSSSLRAIVNIYVIRGANEVLIYGSGYGDPDGGSSAQDSSEWVGAAPMPDEPGPPER